MRHLIIGASIAGLTAAKRIKEISPQESVILLSGEKVMPYSKMALPYILSTATDFESCNLTHPEGTEILLNKYVERVDPGNKYVYTKDGDKFTYDRLLIATGSSPYIPDVPGSKSSSVVGIRNISDIETVKEKINKSKEKRVILSGAGLVNMEIGDALVKVGIPITYVITSDRVLSQIVDREASKILERTLTSLNVELLKGEEIAEIEENKDFVSVKLESGKLLKGSCVVYGKGVRPNVDFLKDTDVKINRGVVLGNYLETDVPDIYGAGDVTETDDIVFGGKMPHALWPVAVEQGKIAAENMLGMKSFYRGDVLRNILTVFGHTIFTGGISTRDEFDVYRKVSDGEYRKIIVNKGKLKGFVFVGETVESPGAYLKFMKEEVDISNLIVPVLNGTLSHIDQYSSLFKVAL